MSRTTAGQFTGIRAVVEEGIAAGFALEGSVPIDVVVKRTEVSGRGDEMIGLARSNIWR